jgi:hypothetical protein
VNSAGSRVLKDWPRSRSFRDHISFARPARRAKSTQNLELTAGAPSSSRSPSSWTSIARLLLTARCSLAALAVAAAAVSVATPASGAPDFTLPSLGGLNLRLQEQRGRVVMVNFCDCGPAGRRCCLARLYDKYWQLGFRRAGGQYRRRPRSKAAKPAGQPRHALPVLLDTDKKVSWLWTTSARCPDRADRS